MTAPRVGTRLHRFLFESELEHPEATGELSALLSQLALAGKRISRALSSAGLMDVLGASGKTNVQGETQQKLDAITNEIFLEAFAYGQLVPSVVTEEMVVPAQIREWNDGPRRFVEWLREPDPATRRPYSTRYSGALVGDFHRILLKGGIYLYPATSKNPQGKLRLLYEGAPLAAVAEAAGGAASDGTRRILDIVPSSNHQRVPLFLGSRGDVERLEACVAAARER